MKIRFTCPVEAQLKLKEIYHYVPGNRTPDVILEQFARENGYVESYFRNAATIENITISEAVRRVFVKKHPQLAQVWPERARTVAQLAHAKRLAAKAHQHPVEILKACDHIDALLLKRDDAQVRRRAREFVEKYRA